MVVDFLKKASFFFGWGGVGVGVGIGKLVLQDSMSSVLKGVFLCLLPGAFFVGSFVTKIPLVNVDLLKVIFYFFFIYHGKSPLSKSQVITSTFFKIVHVNSWRFCFSAPRSVACMGWWDSSGTTFRNQQKEMDELQTEKNQLPLQASIGSFWFYELLEGF